MDTAHLVSPGIAPWSYARPSSCNLQLEALKHNLKSVHQESPAKFGADQTVNCDVFFFSCSPLSDVRS